MTQQIPVDWQKDLALSLSPHATHPQTPKALNIHKKGMTACGGKGEECDNSKQIPKGSFREVWLVALNNC